MSNRDLSPTQQAYLDAQMTEAVKFLEWLAASDAKMIVDLRRDIEDIEELRSDPETNTAKIMRIRRSYCVDRA